MGKVLGYVEKNVKGAIPWLRSLTAEQRDILQTQEDREIVKWLSDLNFWGKQDDTFERHEKGTGEWMLNDPRFESWINGDTAVLWCPGDRIPLTPSPLTQFSRCGKDDSCVTLFQTLTDLRSIAINYLEENVFCDNDVTMACVYFDHKQNFKPVDILRSILKSVVRRSLPVSDKIRELRRKHSGRETRPTLKEVAEILADEIQKFKKVFIVLDALDECPEESYTVSKILEEMRKLQPTVHLMVTGRPFAAKYMSQFEAFATLEIRAHDADVEKFVRGHIKMDESIKKYVLKENELDELVETVVGKAQGM